MERFSTMFWHEYCMILTIPTRMCYTFSVISHNDLLSVVMRPPDDITLTERSAILDITKNLALNLPKFQYIKKYLIGTSFIYFHTILSIIDYL